MKIFFLGGRKSEKYLKLSLKVVETLEKLGHQVDKSQINETHSLDSANFETAYHRNLTAIKKCDILVAESTELSSGLGFLMASAMNEKKPVLSLYCTDEGENPSITLKAVNTKYFTYGEYSKNTLEDVLSKFTEKIKATLDTKFILIIPAEIDRYLEWASDYKRMHKAQIVREAVEKYMETDFDWKKTQMDNK